MEISEKQLHEFMNLYRQRFGKPIERKDAQVQAGMLLQLVHTLKEPDRPVQSPDA